jgi:hypothetical protein
MIVIMKKRFLGVLSSLVWFHTLFIGNIVYAAGISIAATTSDVTITNNTAGTADTIYVTGVVNGDVITLYSAAGKTLSTKTVKGQNTDATISVAQLGVAAGTVYITVTSTGLSESTWTAISYPAESESEEPLADNITITNNSGKSDTIYVCGLAPGDKINIYTAATEGKLIGSATVGSNTTVVTKSIAQLGLSSGSIYISVTSKGMHESGRVEAEFSGENQTDKIDSNNVTITNNSEKSDTIYICGLVAKDKVQIYNQSSGGNPLASATVSSSKTEATISLSQLTTDSGYIYISNTGSGMLESDRTKVSYSDEDESSSVSKDNVTITNNSGTSDTIYVTGLIKGDTVNVYNSSSDGSLLGSATASSSGYATVTIGQLGTGSGSVYISVETSGMLESDREKISYSAELQSSTLSADNIIVSNNSGKSDTVYVSGLSEDQIVNVYNSATDGNKLGSVTVGSNSSEATITISQLGTSAGSVYVSITDTNSVESDRVEVGYSAEGKSDSVSTDNVTLTNNATGTSDTIYVSELTEGDVIKVYSTSTSSTTIGTGTVADGDTDVTISITQFGKSAGSIYITRTVDGKSTSSRVEASYSAESQTTTLDTSDIVVSNNVGENDKIVVSGVSSGQVITVYDASTGGNTLGTATVSSGSTKATITVSQLSSDEGIIYVTLTDTNKLESNRVKVTYSAEEDSSSINADNVTITNNVSGIKDTIYVSGLTSDDLITVYDSDSSSTSIGSGTVADGDTDVTISITQLGKSSGSVYITKTEEDKGESDRVKISYSTESQSSNLAEDNIVITNKTGEDDTIEVSGLSSGQVITVYDASTGGNTLGTATVSSGYTSATVTVSQLGTVTGSVYVSVTDTDKLESGRVKSDYLAEVTSDYLDADNITVTNITETLGSDIVKVTGANANDIIYVYDKANSGTLLGSGTVSSGSSKVSISIDQLGTDSGSIYVCRKSTDEGVSSRVKVDYDAEPQSTAPSASKIIVTNNAGIDDTVEVSGISVGDEIQVYDSASSSTVLGSATVGSSSTYAIASISQLGTGSGNIYVSVTSSSKTESDRTEISYDAEEVSTAPNADEITVVNNSGNAGTVTVGDLTGGDVVNVYDSENLDNLLGTGTVDTYDTSVIVSVTQLGEKAGTIYVTVTSTGKTESSVTESDYPAKTQSTTPSTSNITVTNNAGTSDTVKVIGLSPYDVIKVYNTATGGSAIGTVTLDSSAYNGTVTISQLGTSSGTIYVSVTSTGKTESDRKEVDYSGESQSDVIDSGDVTVKNNSGTSDTIYVTGVSEGDIIYVYRASSSGTAIGSATIDSGKTEATVSVSQLGTSSGTIYVSVKRSGYTESERTAVTYASESIAPDEGDVTIQNNVDISDTITVENLSANTTIRVYDASTSGNLLAKASTGTGNSVTISISQLSEDAGSVYITTAEYGKCESSRTEADYTAEETSASLYSGYVTITNNVADDDEEDTITVTNLSSKDVIYVYDEDENLLGKGTASSSGTVTITVDEISEDAGTLYISVKNYGKAESSTIAVSYTAES